MNGKVIHFNTQPCWVWVLKSKVTCSSINPIMGPLQVSDHMVKKPTYVQV